MKEELYAYLKTWDCYPEVAEHFLDCFFKDNQPERSKREDCRICKVCQEAFYNGETAWCDECHKKFGIKSYKFNRCGALNIVETQ